MSSYSYLNNICNRSVRYSLPPILKYTTVIFRNITTLIEAKKKGIQTYGLSGNELTNMLCKKICAIEGGKYCILVPSGLASIFTTYISLLKNGYGVLIPDNVYQPNYDSLVFISERYNINIIRYTPNFNKSLLLSKCISLNLKLIFVEAPGSITFEIPDISSLLYIASKTNSKVIYDNTYSCGFSFKPFNNGAHISIQALTKFYSGSNDIFMGAIITRSKHIYNILKYANSSIGFSPSPEDCYLILRGIHNLYNNFKSSEIKARYIALFLLKLPFVKEVFHPSIRCSPFYNRWKKYFLGSSGLVTFIFSKLVSRYEVYNFVNNLKLFNIGYSWGGSLSLVMIYDNLSNSRNYMKLYKNYIFIRLYIGSDSLNIIKNDILNSYIRCIRK
ncbi:PLP-dependent transferase [Candidatus Vidania fulgoroideae]|uniref:PLP-dependent transferase n=1 Tax=Candidatus Vidania fulgoroideorum TaxID=881286 RepID=A0A974X7J2_9PROT|nr:PLP-dependent transferase [Candidatus Vidania fulgoroideae]